VEEAGVLDSLGCNRHRTTQKNAEKRRLHPVNALQCKKDRKTWSSRSAASGEMINAYMYGEKKGDLILSSDVFVGWSYLWGPISAPPREQQ
jgi:hypothetical protein